MSGQNLAQEQEHMLEAKRLGAELAEAGLFQQAAKAFKIHLERCGDQEAPVLEMYAQV